MPIVAPLVALDVLVLCLWCIAAALAIAVVMKAVGNAVKGIPGVGGALAGAMGAVAQWITSAAGKLEHGIDHLIGAAWHQLARYTDKLWSEIVAHSTVLVNLAQLVGNLVHSVHGLKALVRALEHAGHGVTAAVKTLEREYHGIEHRVRAIEREIAAGIGNDIRIRIKALERWEEAAKAQLAADAKAIAQTIPAELTQLENFIKAIPGTSYLDWAAGIVTAALGLEIFNLFRCPSLLNSAKNRGCGLWHGLEDLLSLFIDGLILVDLCQIIPEAVTLFGEFEAPLTELISGAANAACARKPNGWVMPMVAAGPLPPPQSLGPLAEG